MQLTGCYSFSEIEQKNDTALTELENQNLKITLFSGRVYLLEPNQHSNNISNSDFIIGKGMVYAPKLSKLSPFEGKIYRSEIDSQILEPNTLYIWLKNQNRISMNKGDYYIFTPDMKRGLWILENSKMELISADDISNVSVESINLIKTSLLVILGLGIIFSMLAGASLASGLDSDFQSCERQKKQ